VARHEADPTRRYHGGNAESYAAHASIEGNAENMRQEIRRYMAEHKDAICDEVEAALGMRHQTASARFTELKRDGVIVHAGKWRKTRSGRYASVWRLAGKVNY
jgi:predicted ArsR family transcriptional regulator